MKDISKFYLVIFVFMIGILIACGGPLVTTMPPASPTSAASSTPQTHPSKSECPEGLTLIKAILTKEAGTIKADIKSEYGEKKDVTVNVNVDFEIKVGKNVIMHCLPTKLIEYYYQNPKDFEIDISADGSLKLKPVSQKAANEK